MWELLSLPEENKCEIGWNKDRFIEKANLTTSEQKILKEFVENVEVKYIIGFNDGSEIVIFDVKLEYRKDKWTAKKIAKIIASSIPYCCMIYVHTDTIGSFSVFQGRVNKLDACRFVIEKQLTIPEFYTFEILPCTIRLCLELIGNDISGEIDNAEVVVINAIKRIQSCQEQLKIEMRYQYDALTREKDIQRRGWLYLDSLQCDTKRELIWYGMNCDENTFYDRQYCRGYHYSFEDKDEIQSLEALIKCAKTVLEYFWDTNENNTIDRLLRYGAICEDVYYDQYDNLLIKRDFYFSLGYYYTHSDKWAVRYLVNDSALQLLIEIFDSVDMDLEGLYRL